MQQSFETPKIVDLGLSLTESSRAMNFRNAITVFVVVLCCFDGYQAADTSDEYLKFVEEIISEDESYYNDFAYVNENEEQIRREEEELKKQTERSEKLLTENERIQKIREEKFARELAQVKEDKAAAKKLLQQRKRDAKTVDRIYKAFQSKNYYAVLGIRIYIFSNLRISNRTITIVPKHFALRVPGFELFYISERQIKRAYREMAKLVHPDKSKDPRAVEAFLLVEKAAAVLLDDETRSEYDIMLQMERKERRTIIANQVRQGVERSFFVTSTLLRSVRKILGPFTIPVAVLVALIA